MKKANSQLSVKALSLTYSQPCNCSLEPCDFQPATGSYNFESIFSFAKVRNLKWNILFHSKYLKTCPLYVSAQFFIRNNTVAKILVGSVLFPQNANLIFPSREKIFVKMRHLKLGHTKMTLFVIKAFRIHFFLVQKFTFY